MNLLQKKVCMKWRVGVKLFMGLSVQSSIFHDAVS
jgi:hypothetical protein